MSWWASADRWWRTQTARQRWRIRVLALITIGCTGTISFESLRNLAHYAGFDWLSWLFPICVDAVAALGMDVWLSKSPAWKLGASLACTAVGLSLLGNAADWWIKREGHDGRWLTALLGIVPPAFLAFELFVMHRHSHSKGGAPQPAPVPPPAEEPAPPQPPQSGAPVVAAVALDDPRFDGVGQAAVRINGNGSTQLVHRDGHVVQDTGAPVEPPRTRSITRPAPPKPPRLEPDEALVVAQLRELDPRGEWSRRKVEVEFGVGSSKATRFMAAARNGR